jgi:hypothetical protein
MPQGVVLELRPDDVTPRQRVALHEADVLKRAQ